MTGFTMEKWRSRESRRMLRYICGTSEAEIGSQTMLYKVPRGW